MYYDTIFVATSQRIIMTANYTELKFQFNKTSNVTYNLAVQFFQDELNVETVNLSFRPSQTPYDQLSLPFRSYLHDIRTTGRVVDVYPLNTTFKQPNHRFLKDSMRNADLANIASVVGHVNELGGTRLIVIDVKDKAQTYHNKAEISHGEEYLREVLANDHPLEGVRAGFKTHLRQLNTRYLICEGSLKADLVTHTFSQEQNHYFHTTQRGGDYLCQIAELVNNGIKVGLDVEAGDFVFGASNYFRAISNHHPDIHTDFHLREIHNIQMTTLYSPYYHESYGPGGVYVSALQEHFGAQHSYDQTTRITRIDIQH